MEWFCSRKYHRSILLLENYSKRLIIVEKCHHMLQNVVISLLKQKQWLKKIIFMQNRGPLSIALQIQQLFSNSMTASVIWFLTYHFWLCPRLVSGSAKLKDNKSQALQDIFTGMLLSAIVNSVLRMQYAIYNNSD